MTTSGRIVEQNGGTYKEAKKANALEKNISAIGNQIFSTQIRSILTQALLQKYDILDCVTVIDLCHAPPTVNVKLASVFFADSFPGSLADGYDGRDNYEHTKRVVERNRQNGSLTVAVMALESSGPEDVTWLLKTFPEPSDPEMKRTVDNDVMFLQRYPDALEKQLHDLRLA